MPTPALQVNNDIPAAPTQELGFGNTNPAFNAPVPATAWDQSEARLKREQKTSFGDYSGSIWRQDGLTDGLVADLVGRQMMPDQNYSPFTDPNWSELTKGISPDLQSNLYQAHSAAHAQYIRERLLQKQEDLTRLGDMGWKGEVGRFALNAVMPDQLLMGMAGGWAVRGASTIARLGKTPIARAVAEAADLSKAGNLSTVAKGVGLGVAENVAFEKMRQSVNFEDDSSQLVGAGLMAAMLGSGISVLGARGTRAAASAASKEHEVLQALQTVHEGGTLTPEQGHTISEVYKAHTALRDFEAGKIDEAGVEKAMADMHGPVQPEVHAHELLDELFPPQPEKAPAVVPTEPVKGSEPAKPAVDPAKVNADAARVKQAKGNAKLREAFGLQDAIAQRDALKAANATRTASLTADVERQKVNTEQARALGQEDPLVPSEKPVEPQVANEAPSASTALVEAPAPKADWLGKDVSWMGPEGDTLYGTVKSHNEAIGKYIVKTDEGMKAVHESAFDTFEHEHAPDGFLHGSVGSAQVQTVGNIAHQPTAQLRIPGTDKTVPARLDIYSVLNSSPVLKARELAYKLIKDPIQNDKFEAQAMTASEWKKQYQREVAGRFHVEAQAAFDEARKLANVPFWKQSDFAAEFYSLVSRVTRQDPNVLTEHANIAGPLQKAAAAQAKVSATLLEHMKAAGVKGAENIAPNDAYVNRMWHHGNIRDAIEKHGPDHVHQMLADSIQNPAHVIERYRKSPGNQGLSDQEILLKKAKGFLGAVRALEYNPALREIHLAGRDTGTLRRELGDIGVTDHQIDDLVDLMFEVRPHEGDAGQAANLKFRFALDENHTAQSPAGKLRVSDLFENDARVLVDTYTSSMAGHIGLARKGIRSQAEWMQHLKQAADEVAENATADGGRVKRDMDLLNDMHKHILGRPMSTQDFSYANRAATALRGYTRGVMLPQLGIAAAFEMNKAVAMLGFRSLIQQLPSLRSLLTAIRQGYIPDKGLARDIQLISGFGNEKAASYFRAQEIESGFFGQSLTRAESGANKVSHAVDVMSGNASFTSLTKQLTGMMTAQNMHDYAVGAKKLTPKMRERWVGQGISDDDIDHVLSKFAEHSSHQDNVLKQIDYENWQKDSPGTYEKFQTFLSRQVRDAIQDHDIGETMPFMHTTLGKVFSELKTFFLVAHAKNFLKQLHYMDATAAQIWAIGFIGESLAYMTQTAINYPTQLDKKLDPQKIATAAFFRMSSMGTASMLAETGYSVLTGGDSLVQPGMTANTDNRSFLKTPSMMVLNRLMNAPASGSGLLFGTDVTTRQEGQDLWGAIPGGNLYGLKAAGQYWTNTLPKTDPTKIRQQ